MANGLMRNVLLKTNKAFIYPRKKMVQFVGSEMDCKELNVDDKLMSIIMISCKLLGIECVMF